MALARAGNVGINYLRAEECLVKHGQAIDLNSRIGDPNVEVMARDCVVTTLMAIGDLEQADSQAQAMLSYAETSRYRSGLLAAFSHAAIPALFKGDWQSAKDFCDRGLSLNPRDSLCLGLQAILVHTLGDFELGEEYLTRLIEVMGPAPTGGGAYIQTGFVPSLIIYMTGDAERAGAARQAAQSVLLSSSITPRAAWVANISLALLAVHQEDQSEAKRFYLAVQPVRAEFPAEGHICISMDRLLGLLAQTGGEMIQASAHFEDALDFCRHAGYRPELAWVCCDYADMLLEDSDRNDRAIATALLDESLAISSELSMRPLMERVLSRRDILKA